MSLRDGSEFGDFVVSCSRASPRDAIPLALRLPRRCAPRNDTNMERFNFENKRLLFYRLFRVVLPRIVFIKRFVLKTVPFSSKPYQNCHCEEGACARRGNL